MNPIYEALELSEQYLKARQDFLSRSSGKLEPWLFGNDNIIGRIGEFLAMLYLEQFHGLNPETARGDKMNPSKQSVDLLASGTWWSVKSITSENKRMVTSRYILPKEGGTPPLLVVQFRFDKGELRARCIAYPEGLSKFGGRQLYMKARFDAREPKELRVERGELQVCDGKPVWKQVEAFDAFWD